MGVALSDSTRGGAAGGEQFNTWVRPLQAVEDGNGALRLLAPNRFVVDWVNENVVGRISELVDAVGSEPATVRSCSKSARGRRSCRSRRPPRPSPNPARTRRAAQGPAFGLLGSRLNPDFTFTSFVEGKSNQLAQSRGGAGRGESRARVQPAVHLRRRRSRQDAPDARRRQHDPGSRNPDARVAYVHSERFVGDMVKALQHNKINEFKTAYRSLDALLIDDIQFFAGKDRSQEEFFHTFNALLEGQQQMILTCDRYPKEVEGLEERLKSRFGWGLTVAIEPPELETCVAILMSKAAQARVDLPEEVAFFIAKRIRSNVRELEGALKRVVANSQFTGRRSRSILPRKRCAICWRCRIVSSRSRTSRRRSRSTTRFASPICSRSDAVVRSHVRARWRWRSRKSSRRHSLAGDRRCFRRPRPHDGAARVPRDQRAA